jgi:selenocysteine lyase/cysteine desulfurase
MNHAGVSPFSTRVVEALHEYLDNRSTGVVDFYHQNCEKADTTRELFGRMIKTRADRIGLVKNTSTGLNILAAGLEWREGDHIILNDMEFPSNIYPFLNLERLGVDVELVKNRGGRVKIEDILDAIKPETVLVSVSHVQFLNGYRIDLDALGEELRSRGVLFVVDVIQSAGVLDIDVERQKIDFLSCGSHKWLMGPQGTGFIYLTQEVQDRISPAYAGWLSVKDSWNFFEYSLDFLDSAARFEIATDNWMGISGLYESLNLLMEYGREKVEEKVLVLTDRLVEGLLERGHVVLSPREKNEKSGIVLFSAGDNKTIFENLMKRSIHIAHREGNLRCSPHFYNSLDEIEMLLDSIG